MGLLDRVATLIRANLNEVIDRAEDPEKMIRQVILDMQNQLLQVKTQVAMAIADEHLLQRKEKENQAAAEDWMRRAEIAVDRKQDELARAALDRAVGYRELAENIEEQVADQKVQVENLKSALRKLEQKLVEAQSKADLLAARHRRSRALTRAAEARLAMGGDSKAAAFDRMKRKVARAEVASVAKADSTNDTVEERLDALEKEDAIEQLLAEMKARRS